MTTIQGFLQAVLPQRIRGWAYLPSAPSTHLTIEILLGEQLLAELVAAEYFADLERAGIGQGDHGFLVPLDTPLSPDQIERVEVIAIAPDGARKALHLPTTRARAGAAHPPPAPAPVSAPAAAAPAQAAAVAPVAGGASPGLHLPGRAPRFDATDQAQRPVFVLGSARSGTTAMMAALRATGRYQGYNEGHLLPLLARLEQAVTNHYGRAKRDSAPGMNTLIAHVAMGDVLDAIQAGFVEIMRATFPTGFWLDKTPGPDMIAAVPLLHRVWPEARFVFMRRHPVDNIESRRRKFPTVSFRDHCRLWADSMVFWHACRDQVGGHSLELDQGEMARDPERAAGLVTTLLDLNAREAGRLLEALRNGRPQITGVDPARHVTLDLVDWDAAQRAIFTQICAEPARLFGYDR